MTAGAGSRVVDAQLVEALVLVHPPNRLGRERNRVRKGERGMEREREIERGIDGEGEGESGTKGMAF